MNKILCDTLRVDNDTLCAEVESNPGQTVQEIADNFGYSRNSVYEHLKWGTPQNKSAAQYS